MTTENQEYFQVLHVSFNWFTHYQSMMFSAQKQYFLENNMPKNNHMPNYIVLQSPMPHIRRQVPPLKECTNYFKTCNIIKFKRGKILHSFLSLLSYIDFWVILFYRIHALLSIYYLLFSCNYLFLFNNVSSLTFKRTVITE